jgi:glucose uptake protein GlcU
MNIITKDFMRLIIILFIIGIAVLVILLIGIALADNKTIDCSNVRYSTNLTKTLLIMKYCTGGEKEVE